MRGSMSGGAKPGLPRGFGAIWTTVAIDLVGFGIILPVLPLYAERFGARPVTIGFLFASFSVAQLLFAPVWGTVSDRIGRKPVLILSLAGTAVGSLMTGLATSVPLLFVGRIIDGMSGASVSVAQAAVADLAERDSGADRARLFGLLGAAFGVGFVAGPALGALAALGGARLPFLVAAAIAGVNALVAIRRLPETRPASLRVGLDARPEGPAAPPVDVATAALSAVPVVPAVAAPPAGPVSTVQDRVVPAAAGLPPPALGRLAGVTFASLVAFSAFEATFALFGERRLNLHAASIAAVFTAVGIVLVLVQVSLVRPAVRWLGETATLRLALMANAGGLLMLASVRSWWTLVPALAALVVGQGLAMPSLTSVFAGRVGERRRGRLLGLQQSAGGLARVVGPIAGGVAFQHFGPASPYLAGAVVMVVCAALVVSRPLATEPQ